MAKQENRFIKTYSQSGFVDPSVMILVDKQTGVNYLFTQAGYAGGMTPLLNRDGSLVITPIPKEYEK